MDDQNKNLILATALSFLVILVWFTLFAPPAPVADQNAPASETQPVAATPAPDAVTTAPAPAEGTEAAAEIAATKGQGGRIIPVGTTALRLIESAASGGVIAPFRGETDIFIRPGYRFRLADGLITNFHLPKSTLLMLVAALMGKERIDQVYAHAIANGYRFFSYGDGSLLIP